ncbi:MAG: DUF6768 family protein [Erythrobacter sp.]|jgi:hypothetical protein|nr:DUF6768 family protein [Erythrobacter sp.]
MTDTDDTIRDALSADDRAFLDNLESERGLFAQLGDSLGGTLGGWAKLVFAIAAVLGLVMLYAGYRTLTASDYDGGVGWGLVLIGTLVLQGFVKEWLFARMNMLTILREVKRLQVQVAMLGEERR